MPPKPNQQPRRDHDDFFFFLLFWRISLPNQGKILQVSRGIECRDLREPLGVVACLVVSIDVTEEEFLDGARSGLHTGEGGGGEPTCWLEKKEEEKNTPNCKVYQIKLSFGSDGGAFSCRLHC